MTASRHWQPNPAKPKNAILEANYKFFCGYYIYSFRIAVDQIDQTYSKARHSLSKNRRSKTKSDSGVIVIRSNSASLQKYIVCLAIVFFLERFGAELDHHRRHIWLFHLGKQGHKPVFLDPRSLGPEVSLRLERPRIYPANPIPQSVYKCLHISVDRRTPGRQGAALRLELG
jgi:hypothetical protein